MQWTYEFFLCFIPLFVAVDPFAVLPTFVGITAGQTSPDRRRTIWMAVSSATLLATAFFAGGQWLLRFLSVEVGDFRIAGGVLLLLIAVREIFLPKASAAGSAASEHTAELAIVPLAIPLIVGPAVLTTGLALVDLYGYPMTLAAFLSIMAILVALLSAGGWLITHVRAGLWAAMSKIVGILLAAIAVAFIRQGLADTLSQWGLLPTR